MPFLAVAQTGSPLIAGGGQPWWQTVGGLLAVFGLLLLSLRLLARWNRGPRSGRAGLLAVWPLGPKREIQVLRLLDEVHFVYRHEGSLVGLRRMSWAEYQAAPAEVGAHPRSPAAPATLAATVGGIFGRRPRRS